VIRGAVAVDPEAEIRPLDVVIIVIRPGDGPWARFIAAAGDNITAAAKLFLGWFNDGAPRRFNS
jgi:hypothetical protein